MSAPEPERTILSPASPPLDCVICLMKQALDGARYANAGPDGEREILERTARLLLERGFSTPAATIGTEIRRFVRDVSGNPDPYFAEKKRCNRAALDLFDRAERLVESAPDPFAAAVRLATAGNSIDFALGRLDDSVVEDAIARALELPFAGDAIDALRSAIEAAETILYLGDNAGEIVLDKLLVKRLVGEFQKKTTFVVRGFPILNDALLDDAREVGMTELVPTISNGSDGLGVHFDSTSPEFNDAFRAADLVIAKGLANYESLRDNPGPIFPKKVAFLFKAKCPFVAKPFGASLGDLVLHIR